MTDLAAVNCGPGTDGAGTGPVSMSARRASAAGDPPTGAAPGSGGANSGDTEGEPASPQSGSPSNENPAWEWFGSPGHLVVAQDCRFHLCTLVGPWLVSTVGEWLPDSSLWDIYADERNIVIEGRGDERRADFLNKIGFVEIGAGRKYETMVFRATAERCTNAECDCEMPVVHEWSELDSDGYNRRGDAHRGHYAMCQKWAATAANGGSPENDQ